MTEVGTGEFGTAAVIAAFLVPLVSLIRKNSWSRQTTYLVGMAAALVSAFAGALVDGNISSGQEFVATFAVSLATSQTLYNLYFKNTELNATLTAKGN